MTTDLTPSQINGRVKVTDVPYQVPGKCAMCGTVKGPVVDIGLQIQIYGVVTFCFTCVNEMASVITRGTEKAPGSVATEYCAQNGLVMITDELFRYLDSTITNLHRTISASSPIFSVGPTGEISETANPESESDSGEFEQLELFKSGSDSIDVAGTFENDWFAGDEGPDSVSDGESSRAFSLG